MATLHDGFNEFAEANFPPNVTRREEELSRDAFFAGVLQLLNQMRIAAESAETFQPTMNDLRAEAIAFGQSKIQQIESELN